VETGVLFLFSVFFFLRKKVGWERNFRNEMKSRTLDSSVFLGGLSLLSLSFCMLFSLSHIFSLFIHAFIDINVLCSCCWLKDLERAQNSTSECLLRYLLLF
jgi:hypothetical protein